MEQLNSCPFMIEMLPKVLPFRIGLVNWKTKENRTVSLSSASQRSYAFLGEGDERVYGGETETTETFKTIQKTAFEKML